MNRNELWTVEQVAAALELHPKTIRRYIRDGVLKATKVGGQWRVKLDDFRAFTDGSAPTLKQELSDDLKGFVDGTLTEVEGELQVCTVIDYYVDSPEAARPVSQALLDVMNSGDPDQKTAKFQYLFDRDAAKARFVVWGNPRFIAKMLNAVADCTSARK